MSAYVHTQVFDAGCIEDVAELWKGLEACLQNEDHDFIQDGGTAGDVATKV